MRPGKVLSMPHGGSQMFLLNTIWRNIPEATQVKLQTSYFVRRYIGILSFFSWRKYPFTLLHLSMTLKGCFFISLIKATLGNIRRPLLSSCNAFSLSFCNSLAIMEAFHNRPLWLFICLPSTDHKVKADLFFCQSLLRDQFHTPKFPIPFHVHLTFWFKDHLHSWTSISSSRLTSS